LLQPGFEIFMELANKPMEQRYRGKPVQRMQEQLKEIRTSIRTGRPYTSAICLKAIEEKLARRLAALPIGRPRKNA